MDDRYLIIIVIAVSFIASAGLFLTLMYLERRSKALTGQEEELRNDIRMMSDYRSELIELRRQLEEQISLGLPDMKLSEECREIYSGVLTGNPILDTLLRFKMNTAEEMNIKFECAKIDVSCNLLSEQEMVSLFGNLIDNAIEAVLRMEQRSGCSKTVQIEMEAGIVKNRWILVVENAKSVDERPEDDGFATTKEDRQHHGIGTKIINKIVRSHHGVIRYTDSGSRFRVAVILPL